MSTQPSNAPSYPRHRRLVTLVTFAASVAGTLVAAAAPAAAAVPGHAVVRQTSPPSIGAAASAFAQCPSGTVTVGTGYTLDGTGNQSEVRVTSVRPYSNGVFVSAWEDSDGYAGTWTVTAVAVCAEAPSGWEIVPEASVTDSSTSHSVYAYCSDGKELIGTGGRVSGAPIRQVVLTGIVPSFYTGNVRVLAYEDQTAPTTDWSATAYAICVDESAVPGLHFIQPGALITSATQKAQTAYCPAGTVVLGAGAHITPHTGPVTFESINPFHSPFILDRVTVTAGEHPSGVSRTWGLRAYAICADL